MNYEGTIAFSDAEIFIVHPFFGTALGLSPLYLWGLNQGNANEEPDLFEYDTVTKDGYLYKAVQLREAKAVTNAGEFKEIWSALADMQYKDPKPEIIKGLSLGSDGAAD